MARKIYRISRESPTKEEFNSVANSLLDAPHMVQAVLLTSMIEHELEDWIRYHLKLRGDDETWGMLTQDSGPLSTFSQKILLGYGLGLYGKELKDNLNIVRNIRNAFAHAKKLIKFDNEAVVDELNRTSSLPKSTRPAVVRRVIEEVRDRKGDPRYRFLLLGLMLWTFLLSGHTRLLKGMTRYIKNRAEAFAEAASPPEPDLLQPLQRPLHRRPR